MKQLFNNFLLLTLCCISFSLQGQTVSTFAGIGTAGSIDGVANAASFSKPNGLAFDGSGNLYVADRLNNKIRKITPQGEVSTFAGSGVQGKADGIGTAASLNNPFGLVIDKLGNLYVTDPFFGIIRKITPEGVVSTFVGAGTSGYADGVGTAALFDAPNGITIDNAGNLYVTDSGNNRIRKITPTGVVSTFAGTGVSGNLDGLANAAKFNYPIGITTDNSGNFYVAELNNYSIRKITPTGVVSTLAGTGSAGNTDGVGTSAKFNQPTGITVDGLGNVYVTDTGIHKIRKITPAGLVSTFSGTGIIGSTDGPVITASFNNPYGIVIDSKGDLYVADTYNNKIRKITFCAPPNIITQPISQTVCTASSANFSISATGDGLTYQWKKGSSNISGANSSMLTLNNVTAVDADNYSCIVTGTCGTVTSNTATLTVQTTVAPITTAQLFCANALTPTVALLTATGTAIKWYTASSGGSPLPSNSVLSTGGYYASQTVNGCEGPRAGAIVTVQYTSFPTTAAQTFCVAQNPSVAQLTATGTGIKWYSAASGGSALSSLVALSTGTYYASQTVNGCEGSRTATSVTVQSTPVPSATTQSFCSSQNATVAQLTATGNNIKWYSISNGGTALSGSTILTAATYYASQTISGCESNTIPVSVTYNSSSYALSNADAVCSSSFTVPLQTIGAIKSGLVGLDFTLNYDQTLITPTGTAIVGAVATFYGDYSLNISTPGQVVVSVYLKNAPSNIFFNGTGNIISINFTVKAGVAINTTGALTTGLIEESTVIGASTTCNASPSILTVVGVVGGKIIYRDDTNNDLGYDATNPALYAPTVITGYGSSCSTPVGVSVMPNTTGIFGYYPGNGSTLKIERDIKGEFNLPPLQCANVQSVINSADYQLALTIANSSYTTPSLYELMTADVNQDGKVTAGDASLISSRSINQYNCEFPQAWNYEWNGTAYVPKSTYAKSKDWIFVPDVYATSPSFVLNMGRNKVPQLPACLPNPPGTASCTASANTIYHALLLGDVNANWTKATNGAQIRESNSTELFFDLENAIESGSTKIIPVYANGDKTFSGIDFSIDYASNINIINLTAADGVSVQWNNIANQRLMVSAYASEALKDNYPVLYLTVNTNGVLTADNFNATSGYLDGENANMRFDGNRAIASSNLQAELFPNPSNGITYLYATDASAFVKVSIYTSNGLLIHENANVPTNENTALPELKVGIYVLKVSGVHGETTKKLIRF